MTSCTTNPQSFSKNRRLLVKRFLLISLSSLTLIVDWQIVKIRLTGNGDLSSLFVVIPIFWVIIILMLRKAIKQQQEIWNSIRINLDEAQISYQKIGSPEVIIERVELNSI